MVIASQYFRPKVLFLNLCLFFAFACGLFLFIAILHILSDRHLPSDSGSLFLKCAKLALGGYLASYAGSVIGHLIVKIQYPGWMSSWESLQWVLFAEYTCSSHEGPQEREVRVCLPHPVESKRWSLTVLSDDTSTPIVALGNRRQEHVLKDPWKPLVVLKSKKGFGVWNAEANLRVEQVDFTSDEVVLTCDLLNDDGVSLGQRREYRISWEKRFAPPSGLLKKSGGTETRPYEAKNAFPEYRPADLQP